MLLYLDRKESANNQCRHLLLITSTSTTRSTNTISSTNTNYRSNNNYRSNTNYRSNNNYRSNINYRSNNNYRSNINTNRSHGQSNKNKGLLMHICCLLMTTC